MKIFFVARISGNKSIFLALWQLEQFFSKSVKCLSYEVNLLSLFKK